jgi:hypothetical protein
MAIFTIATPQRLTPAYNPIKFYFAGTNSGNAGYKFIFDIYQSGTANKIAEYRVLPEYGSGYGLIDLSRLLQSKVSFDFEPNNTTVYDAPNSHYQYDVRVGEEYLTVVQYFAPLTNNGGNVQINVVNSFVVGDQINIVQVGPGNPNLEGLQTVIAVGAGYLVVNSPWSLITNAALNGNIYYADGRTTITRNINNIVKYYVFNGAIPWTEWPSYLYTDYYLTGPSDKFLTSIPQRDFYATLSQDLWMNAVYGGPGPGTHKIIFYNDAGESFEKSVLATDHVTGNAVGPNNHGTLTPIVGTLPLIKPNTEYYAYYYEHNGAQVTTDYRVYIDRRVRMEEHSIVFLDRYGSWGSFAFTGRAYERGTVTREQFNQDVPGYIDSGAGQWLYYTTDRGYINSYVSVDNTIDLNTDWMNEDMAAYFTELISSPYTYFKVSTYYENCELPASTQYVSCNIVTSSFEKYKQRNKNLIRQSITIKLANNDIVNG